MTEPKVSWRSLPFSTRWMVSGLWPQDYNPTTANNATPGGEAGAMQQLRAKTEVNQTLMFKFWFYCLDLYDREGIT